MKYETNRIKCMFTREIKLCSVFSDVCANKEGERRIRAAAVRKPFNKNNNKLTLLPSHIMSIRSPIPFQCRTVHSTNSERKKCVKFHLIAFAMAERPNNLLFRSKLHRRRASENGRMEKKLRSPALCSTHVLLMRVCVSAPIRTNYLIICYAIRNALCEQIINYCVQFQCFSAQSAAARSMHTACALAPLSNGELIFQYHRVPGSCYTKLMCKRQAHRIAIEMPKNYHFEHEKLLPLRPEKHAHTHKHSVGNCTFFFVRAVTAARILQRVFSEVFPMEYLWANS